MAETSKCEDYYVPIARKQIVAVGAVKPPVNDNGDGDYERNLVKITRATYAAGVGLWAFAITCMLLALRL
jgi:hypothetical protein